MVGKVTLEDLIGRFNGLDIKIRLGFFVGILLLVLTIDYFAVLQFELRGLRLTAESIKNTEEDIAKLQADQARLGQIKNTLNKVKEDFNKMQGKIRSLQELPMILEDLSKMAVAAHLTVDQITPSREGQEDFATIAGVKYFALPVVVTAHCGYHNFGQFLNTVENSNVMFLLKDLRLEGSEKQNSAVSVTATLKVIVADRPMEAGK